MAWLLRHKLLGSIAGITLAIIGLGGLPDDIVTWMGWIEELATWLGGDVGRWIVLAIGVGVIVLANADKIPVLNSIAPQVAFTNNRMREPKRIEELDEKPDPLALIQTGDLGWHEECDLRWHVTLAHQGLPGFYIPGKSHVLKVDGPHCPDSTSMSHLLMIGNLSSETKLVYVDDPVIPGITDMKKVKTRAVNDDDTSLGVSYGLFCEACQKFYSLSGQVRDCRNGLIDRLKKEMGLA